MSSGFSAVPRHSRFCVCGQSCLFGWRHRFQIASFSPSTLENSVFKKHRFQIAPLWKAFSNDSVWKRISVDGALYSCDELTKLRYLALSYLLKSNTLRVNKGAVSVAQAFNSTVIQFTQTIGTCWSLTGSCRKCMLVHRDRPEYSWTSLWRITVEKHGRPKHGCFLWSGEVGAALHGWVLNFRGKNLRSLE